MSVSCPISLRRIDSNMVRIIALQVVLFTLLLLITQNSFFALVIFFDFSVRAMRLTYLTPFGLFARFTLKIFKIMPKLSDEAPKRFALYLGLGISLLFTTLFLFGFNTLAMILTAILFFCAVLEMAFDFCIGCKIYYYIQLIQRKIIK